VLFFIQNWTERFIRPCVNRKNHKATRWNFDILFFNSYSFWKTLTVSSPLSRRCLCAGPYKILKYFTDIWDPLFECNPTKTHSHTSLFNVLQQYCGRGSWWRGSTGALKCCMVKDHGKKSKVITGAENIIFGW